MRTMETKVYQYGELSDKAKEKARDGTQALYLVIPRTGSMSTRM